MEGGARAKRESVGVGQEIRGRKEEVNKTNYYENVTLSANFILK